MTQNGDIYLSTTGQPGEFDYLCTVNGATPQIGLRWAGGRQYRAGRILTTDSGAIHALAIRPMQPAWVVWDDMYMRITDYHIAKDAPHTIGCSQGGPFGFAEIDGKPVALIVVEPSPPSATLDWFPAERARAIRDYLGEPGDHLVMVPDDSNPGHLVTCDPWAPEFTRSEAGNDVRNE
ncbi:hypothetical protein IRT45_34945 [Nocardia sp. BSTN01]|uniref:hypothetical protein n=1 Tax=Nocardia sp. BSTN01 TaxID=2783665 RepID=UPI00188E1D50|nr:hypothetical protein [Nocardia sp. BSTN01]MBF5002318.1 hypothetical protein [Nocardia sp. BSTN01]